VARSAPSLPKPSIARTAGRKGRIQRRLYARRNQRQPVIVHSARVLINAASDFKLHGHTQTVRLSRQVLNSQPLAIVSRRKIQLRSNGTNARRINIIMRDVIVPLDMVYVHRLRNGGSLVQIQQIAMKIRVINNPAHVALK